MKISIAVLFLYAISSLAQASFITPYAHYAFDETSGFIAHDSGSRGLVGDGTLIGYDNAEPAWMNIDGRNVLAFNGSDNYVRSYVGLPSDTIAYTIEAKLKFTSYTPNSTIVKNWGSASVGAFHFGLDGNSEYLSNYIGTDPLSLVVSANPIPLNQWLTLTVSYDGGIGGSNQQRLFVNGSLVATGDAFGMSSIFGTLMFIGAKGNDAGDGVAPGPEAGWFNGYMDDLKFYTSQLPPGYGAVPEPSTYALFGLGAIGLLMVMSRKKTA